MLNYQRVCNPTMYPGGIPSMMVCRMLMCNGRLPPRHQGEGQTAALLTISAAWWQVVPLCAAEKTNPEKLHFFVCILRFIWSRLKDAGPNGRSPDLTTHSYVYKTFFYADGHPKPSTTQNICMFTHT